MSESEKPAERTGRWPLNIDTFLALLLLLALLLGWWGDHKRLANELVDARLDREMKSLQIQGLKNMDFSRSDSYRLSFSSKPFKERWTPSEFVNAVAENRDHEKKLELASGLYFADNASFDAVIEGLLPMVQSPSSQIRINAIEILKTQCRHDADKMKVHFAKFTDVLLPLLDESHQRVGEGAVALRALQEIGVSPSKDAINKVSSIMNDDDHPLAVLATLTVAKMDLSIRVGPRLIQLIDQKHESWVLAAKHLHEHLSKTEAYEYLKSKYRQEADDADQQTYIEAMNEIEW